MLKLWYFRGFPAELYDIRYPAPGQPELAEEILHLLANAGLAAHANSTRPRDHGVWMPLLHMYPDADIPVVEISLPMNWPAEDIYKIGHTLAPLREKQVFIIGSGSITHNLAELTWRGEPTEVPVWASSFRNYVVSKLAHQIMMLYWTGKQFPMQNEIIRP